MKQIPCWFRLKRFNVRYVNFSFSKTDTFRESMQDGLSDAWMLTFNWIQLRENHATHKIGVTCCKTSLPWTSNVFSQPATTWFVAKQVGFFGGKTHNITVHLVWQQCYDLCLSFWSNFIWIIFVLRIPLMIRMRGMLNLKMANTQQPAQFTPRHYIWGKQFHCTLRWFF